eukprot:6467124-Amphidinium_carterae.1
MLLHQPGEELLTGGAALARGVKDGWHHTVKKETEGVCCWSGAIFSALGCFLGTQVRLDVCKHGGGCNSDINAHREASEIMKNGIGGVGGPGARCVAHGLNMDGLFNAGEQTRLACKGHKGVTYHVVAANDQRPRARLGMPTKGVQVVATSMQG